MLVKLGLFAAALGLFAVAPGLAAVAPGLAAVAPGLAAVAPGLAAVTRLRVTGRLAGGGDAASVPGSLRARGGVLWGGVQAAIGLAIVLAAGVLASMTPAIQQQPLWPFPWRLTFAALDDPDIRVRVALALVAAGVGVAGMVLGLLWRRARIGLLAFGACLLAAAAPTVRLLLVEAYPTSYYHSPTGFAAASITHGADIFAANCAPCHGTDGRGDGVLAAQLPMRPADLTAAHLWGHSDGELFWWVSNGRQAADGTPVMPAFAPVLSETDRWSVIDFVRANNAGTSERNAGAWVVPIAAPALPIVCAGLAADEMQALHGSVVRVVADGAEDSAIHPPAIPPQEGYQVVILHLRQGASRELRQEASQELRGGASRELRGGVSQELRGEASQELRHGTSRGLPMGECMAATSAAWGAYATLVGLPADALAGAEFLVDPNGWLRAAWLPASGRGWSTPDQLIARVRLICTHPIAIETGGGHEHRD
jgi:mono/diheme cytochrome c family protein